MEIKNILSFLVALAVGLLAVAPPIPYDLPVTVNHFYWVYAIIACALMGFFLLSTDLHWSIKAFEIYLFVNCFFSQVPYLSFNAFMLFTACIYFFLLARVVDLKITLSMVEAAFWVQIALMLVQYFGLDTLLNFDRPKDQAVFLGTVFQEMRLSSMFAVMAPLLILKNRWYALILPVIALYLKNLGLAYALALGVFVYSLVDEEYGIAVYAFAGSLVFSVVASIRAWTHIYVEVVEGRIPIWWVIIKSWMCDTSGKVVDYMKNNEGVVTGWVFDKTHHHGPPDIFGASQTGPFQADRLFFGRGLDTFLVLFPHYKHDMNAFPNAHNSWLQIGWETGLIGLALALTWFVLTWRTLSKMGASLLCAGLAMYAVQMFFAFPDRMTQTWLLLAVFAAMCTQRIKNRRVAT